MKLTFFLIIFLIIKNSVQSDLVIRRISMRHLRKNDVGLIFDADIYNVGRNPRESLIFSISSEKCCLQITNNETDCQISRLITVNNIRIEPEKELIVSLLWPSLILYNRVGNCSIVAEFTRKNSDKVIVPYYINFNTSIDPDNLHEYMIYYFNDMKKENGYTKCDSIDLNPFGKCEPENCEIKYFGKRNYFNKETKRCETVPTCNIAEKEIYDFQSNECQKYGKIYTEEDFKSICPSTT